MHRMLKFFHYLGMTMFLGSIFTYLLISAVVQDKGLVELVFARVLISKGTAYLTIPGMWVAAATGVVMASRKYGLFAQSWITVKTLAMLVIVLNAHFIVGPAVEKALAAARESLASGAVVEWYKTAYIQESVFGAINVLLAVLSMAAGIWKFRRKEGEKISN